MSVGKIWQMSAVEIASIFIAAFGIAALYAIIYCIFVPKEKVAVDESKGIFVFGKKRENTARHGSFRRAIFLPAHSAGIAR